jgi:hypothetical protein
MLVKVPKVPAKPWRVLLDEIELVKDSNQQYLASKPKGIKFDAFFFCFKLNLA